MDKVDVLQEYWSEFNRRLIEDEMFAAKLPDGAVVFLLPESEPEACARAKETAMKAAQWTASRLVETGDEREYVIAELPDRRQEVVFVTIPDDGGEWDILPAEKVLDTEAYSSRAIPTVVMTAAQEGVQGSEELAEEVVVIPAASYRTLVQYITELEQALSSGGESPLGSDRRRVVKEILAEYTA